MKRELLTVLACPVCKGDLELIVYLERGDEVIEGRLHCAKCTEAYPIRDAIPQLLPPQLRTGT